MDANQEEPANPFGMDEGCTKCAALCESRERIVHGYGDVGADFLFVGDRPGAGADRSGVPLLVTAATAGDPGIEPSRLRSMLERVDLVDPESPTVDPAVENAFFTGLTRCHHPDRGPTDEEIANCDPFLTAEIRMINPEILIPVGERALRVLAAEYTTRDPAELDVVACHAEELRGRGFELLAMQAPDVAGEDGREAWLEAFSTLLGRDYRQTKGRRGR